jgi:hypothetical protein
MGVELQSNVVTPGIRHAGGKVFQVKFMGLESLGNAGTAARIQETASLIGSNVLSV